MKILIIIGLFIFFRILFKTFLIKNDSKYSNKEKNDEIIDVDYEELK